MASFEELGLREELVRTLEDEDIERPTALQGAVVPALRRGTNVVARASTGSGKTLTYVLGVLDRLAPREEESGEPALRVLILVPTLEEAERVALAAFPYVQSVGAAVAVPGGGWGTDPATAEIVVAPAADAMSAVRSSVLKLDAVESIVIDGGSAILEVGGWDQVDAILDLVPRDAQRALVSAAFPEEVQDVVDRRVKRALAFPSEAALPDERPTGGAGTVNYVPVRAAEKLDTLVRQLAQPKEGELPPVIFCRTDERAAELAEQLAVRGFLVGSVTDAEADVAVVASDESRESLLEEGEGELGQTISYDVPADPEMLAARHGGDADAVIIVEPRELAHVREIATRAGVTARAIALPTDRGVTAARLEEFRSTLRRAIAEEDLAAQTLVLDPLLDEFSALEIAAAAAALLRRKPPAAPAATPVAAPAPATPQARAGAETGPAPAAWSRLYVGVGSRDEIRAGDLVGTLAGEANIPGSRIGKIEIRDNFSIVEVEASVADQVIRAVNGTTIKGRSVRVDYDRGGDRARKGGGGPPRRQAGRPAAGARRVIRRPPRDEHGKD